MKNILVIAAHPDDELLGLGATLNKHILNGNQVSTFILGEGLTSRKSSRNSTSKSSLNKLQKDALRANKTLGIENVIFGNLPDNRLDSMDRLEIIKRVESTIETLKPSIIYTHHEGDRNIDHRIIYDAVLTACRPLNYNPVKELITFETPSSTEWGFMNSKSFNPNLFVDVTDQLNVKLKAFEEYSSEIRDFPHPRSLRALKAMAEKWGSAIGTEYAEAFRIIWKRE